MTDKKRIEEALDACPFPPDRKPPEKDGLSKILNFYDEVFGNWKIVVSILSVASLFLAYSLLSVPPPLVVPVSEPDTWGRSFPEYPYTPREEYVWVTRFENQTVHEGDLLLEGVEVLVIENCTYMLKGQLLARDNARLILRNAELFVQEKDSWGPTDLLQGLLNIAFNDSAAFESYNSSIHPEYFCKIGFLGGSKAFIDSSRIDRTFIYGDEESTIQVTNSNIESISVAGDANCMIFDSEVSSIACSSILDLIRWPELEGDWRRCRVEVWNSTLKYIYFKIMNCNAMVSTPLKGFHSFWNSYEYLTGERGAVFNVTLHDTNVTGYYGYYLGLSVFSGNLRVENVWDLGDISVQNGSLQITNSSILSISCTGDSMVDIADSNMRYLSFDNSVHANISRSKTELLMLENFKDTAHFNMFLVDEVWLDETLEAYIKGSVSFGENVTRRELNWIKGVVTRNFEVWTQGEKRVLSKVHLTLYNKEDEPIWSGQTDKNGRADFNISFCKWWPLYEPYKYVNNYEDHWRLEAVWGETRQNATVGLFLTETPILFTFKSVSEPPLWTQSLFLTIISVSTIVVMIAGLMLRHFLKSRATLK
jgi:hypothetical protein